MGGKNPVTIHGTKNKTRNLSLLQCWWWHNCRITSENQLHKHQKVFTAAPTIRSLNLEHFRFPSTKGVFNNKYSVKATDYTQRLDKISKIITLRSKANTKECTVYDPVHMSVRKVRMTKHMATENRTESRQPSKEPDCLLVH